MTDNVYLNIAQEKGLIDQDDYQGWRLTAKGERFLSLTLNGEQRMKYECAAVRLSDQLNTGRSWWVTRWTWACLDDHPDRIKVEALGKVPFTSWVDVELVGDTAFNIAQIIAGQYESALRQAVEG